MIRGVAHGATAWRDRRDIDAIVPVEMFRHLLLPALVIVWQVAACSAPPSGLVDSAADDPNRHIGIAPGGFTEVNLNMGSQDTVTATFETDGAALRWDVHSHPGDVVIHDEGVAAAGLISFTAPEAGQFSVLWENQGSSAIVLTVRVDLTGTAEIASWITNP